MVYADWRSLNFFLKQTLKAKFKAVSEVLLWLFYLSLIKNIFLSC